MKYSKFSSGKPSLSAPNSTYCVNDVFWDGSKGLIGAIPSPNKGQQVGSMSGCSLKHLLHKIIFRLLNVTYVAFHAYGTAMAEVFQTAVWGRSFNHGNHSGLLIASAFIGHVSDA